jgi:hypothetical protein
MGVFMDFKKSQHRLPCPQTYRVANKQPSTSSTTKRPSFWLSKTLSFASIHYDGESGRLDEFVLKFSPKWIRLEAKIQIANFRLALYSARAPQKFRAYLFDAAWDSVRNLFSQYHDLFVLFLPHHHMI